MCHFKTKLQNRHDVESDLLQTLLRDLEETSLWLTSWHGAQRRYHVMHVQSKNFQEQDFKFLLRS